LLLETLLRSLSGHCHRCWSNRRAAPPSRWISPLLRPSICYV